MHHGLPWVGEQGGARNGQRGASADPKATRGWEPSTCAGPEAGHEPTGGRHEIRTGFELHVPPLTRSILVLHRLVDMLMKQDSPEGCAGEQGVVPHKTTYSLEQRNCPGCRSMRSFEGYAQYQQAPADGFQMSGAGN